MANIPGAPLFGRSAELAKIRHLLVEEHVRFLTLIGPGGTGKTRVAQAVAADELGPPLRAIHFVDLAVVDDPADVPAAIAQAIGVQESGSASLAAILRDVIGQRAMLLVLDNFEHVLGAASFVANLLSEAPNLACLATSREPVHIRAERVFVVEPLSLPPVDISDPAGLIASPSVALFVDRGQAREADFALTPDNAPVVAEICRRLDGLPLAIELAAAQVSVLSPRAILSRLEAHEPFVLGGARDLPARHQTLHAAMMWSYHLLDAAERLVFRRCGIFSATFSPAAVAALGEDADWLPDPLGTLAVLADKNLLHPALPAAVAPRFRLLETIRAFALDLLVEGDELPALRRRHAAYFLELAEQAEPALVGPDTGRTLDRLEHEYDNFRAVLYWSMDGGDLAVGLRLAGALNRFWMLRGHLGEARQWLERALPQSLELPVEVRAKAHNVAGVLAGVQGDNAPAEAYFNESFRLWQAVGDPIPMAAAMGNLGLTAQDRQDVDRALECFRRAEALYAEGHDQRGIAVSMGSRAHLARQLGNTAEAIELFEQALDLFRQVGDPRGIANSLANLGLAQVALHQPQQSITYFTEALQLRRSLGNTLGVAECLEGFAAAAATEGQARRAARLLGAAAALREITGAPLPAADRGEFDAVLRRIRRRLSPRDFERERATGGGWTVQQAVEFALVGPADGTSLQLGSEPRLSPREQEVARLVARGLTNRQIADALLVTHRTIGTHLEHIFAKLDVQTRAEVAVWITRDARHDPSPGV